MAEERSCARCRYGDDHPERGLVACLWVYLIERPIPRWADDLGHPVLPSEAQECPAYEEMEGHMVSNDELSCPYCGADHVDGRCQGCRDWYCDECLRETTGRTLCPNCDGRANETPR